jgi:hypothetical protein
MSEDSHLYDYQDIGTFGTPGFEGTWACSPVVEMGKKNKVGCFRFMPKKEMSSIPDTRFTEGKIDVITYLEGRTVDPNEEPNGCLKDRFKSDLSKFQEFRFNLTMGAFQNMFVSAAALAACLTATTF